MSPADLRTRPTHDSGLQSTELDTHGGGFGVLPPWASSRSTPAAEGLGCCLLVLLEVDTRGSVLPPHGLSNKMDHRRPCSAHCIGDMSWQKLRDYDLLEPGMEDLCTLHWHFMF